MNDEAGDGPDLVKNTNAADVHAAARERREQSRLDAQKKKEKDKEDRFVNTIITFIKFTFFCIQCY